MKSRLALLLAGSMVLLGVAAPGQTNASAGKEGAGVLEIYSFPTQINTVARRSFTDVNGRRVREIFYTAPHLSLREKPSEKDLKVQSVRLYRHDPRGLLVETEMRGPNDDLIERKSIEYDERGQIAHSLTFGPTGNLSTEILCRDGRTATTLRFDATGKRLVNIRGKIPTRIDLPDGWGEPVQGLACGIVLSKTNGALDGFEVHLNLKNTGERAIALEALTGGTLVLHDVQGKEIPGNPELSPRPLFHFYGRLSPGEAGYLHPTWVIKDRFPQLPPGRYRLSVRIRIPEPNVQLESNPVTFVVE